MPQNTMFCLQNAGFRVVFSDISCGTQVIRDQIAGRRAPGIIAAVVGRAGDHQLTIRMLNLARRAMLVSAACVLIAAVALALSRTGHEHEPTTLLSIVWGAVTVIAAYCALLLQFARLLPRRNATSLDEKLIQIDRP